MMHSLALIPTRGESSPYVGRPGVCSPPASSFLRQLCWLNGVNQCQVYNLLWMLTGTVKSPSKH